MLENSICPSIIRPYRGCLTEKKNTTLRIHLFYAEGSFPDVSVVSALPPSTTQNMDLPIHYQTIFWQPKKIHLLFSKSKLNYLCLVQIASPHTGHSFLYLICASDFFLIDCFFCLSYMISRLGRVEYCLKITWNDPIPARKAQPMARM